MRIRIRWRVQRKELLYSCHYLFLFLGFAALGFCAFAYLDAALFQAYESRRFTEALKPAAIPSRTVASIVAQAAARDGSIIGKIEIPRLGVSAMVAEGVEPHTLELAAGHIPGTSFPGQPGNVAIAGHRDTFFRNLRKIRTHDLIRLTTLSGSYDYLVESMRVVGPDDVEVLKASSEPTLTLVTCFPFYYVGPAPERFVVRARQIRGPAA